jgi:hypothetical protein
MSGIHVPDENETWVGWPDRSQARPIPMITKLGINMPQTAPTVLTQLEICIPKRFKKVVPQNRTKIKETLYQEFWVREGSNTNERVPAIKERSVGYQITFWIHKNQIAKNPHLWPNASLTQI